MRIVNYEPDYELQFPIRSAGVNLVLGSLLKRGTTPGTNNGMLIPATSGAHPDAIGILRQLFSAADDSTIDTTITGTVYTTRPCDLIDPARIIRIRYAVAAADLIAATEAVGGTTITLTSLENDIDAAFLYVVSGTGAGQTNYLTASAAGSATLKAAFTTALDTTSRLIKILPRFHQLAELNADGTMLTSQAGVGSMTVAVLETWIVRDSREDRMNPVTHDALTGLNGLASIYFEADIVIRNPFTHTID